MRASFAVGAAITAAALTGCGSTSITGGATTQPGTSSAATQPASSAPATATRTPRITDSSGRHPITFDPCLDLPDATIIEFGYPPESKEIGDFRSDHYTFLDCDFQSTAYGLAIASGNITFAEVEERYREFATAIDVNGRRAILVLEPDAGEACLINIETPYGILSLIRSFGRQAREEGRDSCAGLGDTARIIEPFIPREH